MIDRKEKIRIFKEMMTLAVVDDKLKKAFKLFSDTIDGIYDWRKI